MHRNEPSREEEAADDVLRALRVVRCLSRADEVLTFPNWRKYKIRLSQLRLKD